MMTKNDWFPVCFDLESYQQWKFQQRQAQEVVTVCDDCRTSYMEKMIEQERCFPLEAKKNSTNSQKK
jgi:hypothetical protein